MVWHFVDKKIYMSVFGKSAYNYLKQEANINAVVIYICTEKVKGRYRG